MKRPIRIARIRRSAEHIPQGREIFAWLQQPEIVEQLIATAENGEPSVSGIAQPLLDKFGETIKELGVKQFIGTAVRHIMENNNYIPEDRGVRIHNNPVFATGMTYIKAPEKLPPPKKLSLASVNEEGETLAYRLLNAVIPVMTTEEKRSLLAILQSVQLKKAG